MARKNNHKNSGNGKRSSKPRFSFELPEKIKRQILGVLMLLATAILILSFFQQAGPAGRAILKIFEIAFGKTSFILPLIFLAGSLVFFKSQYEKFFRGVVLAVSLLVLGLSATFELLGPGLKYGGYLGYAAKPFFSLFGFYVTQIIFGGALLVGVLIFWHLLRNPAPKESAKEGKPTFAKVGVGEEKKPSLIQKFFLPKFKMKEVEEAGQVASKVRSLPTPLDFQTKDVEAKTAEAAKSLYKVPPLDLLESEHGSPSAGDIRMNSAVIKKTLENFGIPVEMSEINIGPTVTQYTLKPAEGIKLSKITALSNDLALALANHPIRIEAPIPGKPLVGIEVPNKARAQVRLREMIGNSQFQNSPSSLALCLGKDVSGSPVYADLAKMPHLLVAGSTGTGKTIFLNNLILSFLYRNGPDKMRLILIDPKRVEFPVYNDLPHLLCRPILDSQKTVNALRWLVSEMERRFEVLSSVKTRDIRGYNEIALKEEEETLPYIVVVIDELADLMAARGKEVEAGIVRLAQMARAVGIHLIVATQRPSVEVITGLIKANITSRVTFQVASQIDSRTVLDVAGAEKLLGAGDLLFISADVVKPKRIQGAYVSEREVKKVAGFIRSQNARPQAEKGGMIMIDEAAPENHLAQGLQSALDVPTTESNGNFYGAAGEDSLYEEAKRVVIESKKASASLLQRRLRVGYARAARLLDILEGKGVVGAADGAKPRAVFAPSVSSPVLEEKTKGEDNGDGWEKI